jgi:catechol 2,3-dioxygenase-like lactoylglutathione lyase family enzyme
MGCIPHVIRRGARYHFRRRVHLRNIISTFVTVPLRTADPGEARKRAAALSARFELVRARHLGLHTGEWLSAKELADLFRAELENELGLALRTFYEAPDPAHAVHSNRLWAEAYDIARRPDRPSELTADDEFALLHLGYSELDIEWIRAMLDRVCADRSVDPAQVEARLLAQGITPTPALVQTTRAHILRARAAAYRRACEFMNPVIQDAEDPVQSLLNLKMDARGPAYVPRPAPVGRPAAAPSVPQAEAPQQQHGPFEVRDERRLSEAIDGIVADLRKEKRWKGSCTQQIRIARTFAWITGDKRLCDYNHLDVDIYKRALRRIPGNVRFGSKEKGPMSMPIGEFLARLPDEVDPELERSDFTINRDLSTMSTIHDELAKTAWRPRIPNTKVLDFKGALIGTNRSNEDEDRRPPWRLEHMIEMLHSRLYTGGGGSKRRLKQDRMPAVFHDAAYWCPLLWYYHHTCREEMCGLEVADVFLDDPIPNIVIQDNVTRGTEEEKKGAKRIARTRALPIHRELLRLGFADYVRAIAAEGHVALFPELYINKAKRGGDQFYGIAWVHIVNLVAETHEIPVSEDNGKEADIHSIRTLGSSFYERRYVNKDLKADIMGHAREGTDGKHYSKRIKSEGKLAVLEERRALMEEHIPEITSDIRAHPIRLLPLDQRSRVGSGRPRKIRSDCKTSVETEET